MLMPFSTSRFLPHLSCMYCFLLVHPPYALLTGTHYYELCLHSIPRSILSVRFQDASVESTRFLGRNCACVYRRSVSTKVSGSSCKSLPRYRYFQHGCSFSPSACIGECYLVRDPSSHATTVVRHVLVASCPSCHAPSSRM